PHTDDVASEALAALGERHVVAVACDDHDVREVGQAEHVLDGIHRESDVGTVLRIGGGGEQLHEIYRTGDELRAVLGVHGRGPVGVGAGEHQGAEGGGVVDDRPDLDHRLLQPLDDL